MKSIKNYLRSISLFLCFMICMGLAGVNTSHVPSADLISSTNEFSTYSQDVIVTKYRVYKGRVQYRRIYLRNMISQICTIYLTF